MGINLLPPEYRQRQTTRRRTGVVIAVAILLLVALGGLYVLQVIRLAQVRDDLRAQEAQNAELERQIGELQRFQDLLIELQERQGLLQKLLANAVPWSGVLRDISLVIPGEAWLSGLSGTLTGEAQAGAAPAPGVSPSPGASPGAPTGQAQGLAGQITFTGFAFDHRDVALWLARLEDVRGFENPWLSNSTKTLIGATEVVQFTSSVDLSRQAVAQRSGP